MCPASASNVYTYRAPRLEACFPVHFKSTDEVLLGWTENISEQGLLVRFEQPVLPGRRGHLRLAVGRCTVELEAVVIHSEAFTAGLRCLFASEQERSFLGALLQVVSKGELYSAAG